MIRSATLSDCLNITALSLQVWLDSYTLQGIRKEISQYVLDTLTVEHFERLLQQKEKRVLLYEKDQHLVGLLILDLSSKFVDKPDAGYEIETLYVSRHFQGQDIGRALLQEAVSGYGSPMWLSTWIHNTPALAFYERLGFTIIGEVSFLLDGETHANHVLAYTAESGSSL
ncbi:N-acetyltransferase [Veronia nyctiphanis]|uniref:N-acetyltransferase n=1 Tax=Veronia nyctiphanis TaxID=1278244 RepID=A0A4Q0YUF0_9GAMM|nr:N-acetyltransferase [Veronia nyctiphanis]RXJ74415.1 N-acetyltransferase [Veronia nyctiphanis]